MTPIEAMKAALVALKVGNTHTIDTDTYHRDNKVIHALTSAIEGMEREEPVAWWNPLNGETGLGVVDWKDTGCTPLYALPWKEKS